MGTNFRDLLNERLQNEDFKKEYDSLEPEYELVKAFLEARKNADMTQSELAKASGVAQSDISKLENGNSNPTVKMLWRLADSMNMHLKIEFVPNHWYYKNCSALGRVIFVVSGIFYSMFVRFSKKEK